MKIVSDYPVQLAGSFDTYTRLICCDGCAESYRLTWGDCACIKLVRDCRSDRGTPLASAVSWHVLLDAATYLIEYVASVLHGVEDRALPGHWEGDLIIGAKGQSAVGTLVERSTRYTLLLYLPNGHTATEVQDAIIDKLAHVPHSLRLSLTWDQGSELAQHRKIASELGLDVYFCDPHSPWQRGTNENTNGLLRQYMPKGTDLSLLTEADLDAIADQLNDRPRKTLNWDTPKQRLELLLRA